MMLVLAWIGGENTIRSITWRWVRLRVERTRGTKRGRSVGVEEGWNRCGSMPSHSSERNTDGFRVGPTQRAKGHPRTVETSRRVQHPTKRASRGMGVAAMVFVQFLAVVKIWDSNTGI
eukprot:scaffold1222_cov317-Pavlova_lutheri.AAC.8